MRDVSLGEYGSLSGGVLLSPDGLTFITPATLTVTGGGYGADSLILQGDHNGGNVDLIYYEASANGVSAEVWHFSSKLGELDNKGNINLGRMRDRNAERVFDSVAKYHVENPVSNVPEPPSLTFNNCPNHDNNREQQILENYWKAFREPEYTAIMKIAAMNSTRRWEELADPKTPLPGSMNNDRWYMSAMKILFDRLKTKLLKLDSDYSYQEDKYKAIAYVANKLDSGMMVTLQIACGKNSMGGSNEGVLRDSTYSAIIKKWGKEVWNDWMKKLVENHNYMAAHALMEVQRFNDLVGVESHNYSELLGNALTFKVEHKIDFNGEGLVFYKLSGNTTVKMDQINETTGIFGSKAGTGNYDSATMEEANFKSASSYDQTVELSKLDPCMNKTITAGFSVFGLETENWATVIPEFGVSVPFSFPGAVYISFYTYAKSYIDPETGFFNFQLPLTNMSAQAADDTYFWSGEVTLSLDVTVTHTPEGEVYIK
jgi:hypothetical protein